MTVFSELRMRPAAAGRWSWNASNTSRLVMAGVVIFTLLVGANLATPLYPLLQAKLGISTLGVTVAFSAYVLALVSTLLLAGHWSDHIGRRAALLLAVLTGLAGGFVFAHADSLPSLCAGRALQGIAVALATGASSAALRELLPQRPEWASRFTLLASAGGVAAARRSAACCPSCRDRPPRRTFCTPWSSLHCWSRSTCSAHARPSSRPSGRAR
nr:MFS transporter [Arthrobacter sp. KBS0703]